MLNINQLNGFNVGSSVTEPSVTYVGSLLLGTGATVTFSGTSLGDAFANREVFCLVTWRDSGSATTTINSATIGGVSSTIHRKANIGSFGTSYGAAIISSSVPTGTTGDVVLNMSDVCEDANVQVISVINLSSTTAYHTASNVSNTTLSSMSNTLNLPNKGIAFGIFIAANSSTVTWTVLSESLDSLDGAALRISSAYLTNTTATTGATITVSFTSATARRALVTASFV